LQGVFSLQQICGPPASLHGHSLELFTRYSVYNVASQSLLSIESASAFSKSSFDDNDILSLFDQYGIPTSQIELHAEWIRKSGKIHHGLSIFFVEQLQSTWIASMKEYCGNGLSSQWLFHKNTDELDDANDETNKSSQGGFQHMWPGMGAFRDSHVSDDTQLLVAFVRQVSLVSVPVGFLLE
jgi:hypothetical protein